MVVTSAIYPMQWMRMIICSGMAVKKMGMLGVSVKKMKALIVTMETGTLIGIGRYNLTCFLYYV